MRKFKTSKIDDEKFNQKFEEDLKEIKEKLHAEKPSDEFKQNLQAILEEELNKTSDKKERKIYFPIYAKKLAAVCACLIIFFSGCFTFADDIENVIFKIFGNADKVVEDAIAKGNYQKIDMEYVEDNGISIKVDYVAIEKNNLYIVLNIVSKEKFNEIYIRKICIKDQNNFVIYTNKGTTQNATISFNEENLNNKNSIIIYNIKNNDYNFNDLNTLNMEFDGINILENANKLEKNGVWDFKINI